MLDGVGSSNWRRPSRPALVLYRLHNGVMTTVMHRWAILVATQHGKAATAGMTAEVRRKEMRQLLGRAKSIASPLRTVALVTEQFEQDWRDMADELPPRNFVAHPASEAVLDAIAQSLDDIRARETDSSVILIPADHCAAVDSSWVKSAREALSLAAVHKDTVYLLHDKPHEGRVFDASRDLCSSTVVVGSAQSLLELSHGTRPTHLIEFSTGEPPDPQGLMPSAAGVPSQAPIRIVRIQSVEEYARLQRGEYSRPPAVIDVRA
jgi:hypothetical protein